MSKRQKVHQLIVTVTHDEPVTQREAVKMFKSQYCWGDESMSYYGNVWRNDAGVAIGEGDTVTFHASFKSVKAYKP